MRRYLYIRLASFLPGLALISMIVFYLSAKSPVTAVSDGCLTEKNNSWTIYQSCLRKKWERFGLNKPIFYFSFHSLSEPNKLYLIFDTEKKDAIKRLLDHYGNWPEIKVYFQSLAELEDELSKLKSTLNSPKAVIQCSDFKAELIDLRRRGKPKEIQHKLSKLHHIVYTSSVLSSLSGEFSQLENDFEAVEANPSTWKKYIPWFSWHGWDNRYHNWIKNAVQGDWGEPYGVQKNPINTEIKSRIGVTFSFALLNALIVYLLSIPFGVWAARNKTFDKISGNIFFAISSIPGFWLGVLLLLVFANPKWPALDIFPTGYDCSGSFLSCANSMVLPLIVYVYASLAALSRITRNSLLEISQLDYMRTARAKGLSESQVYWRHGLRNAILPNISLLIYVFPAMFSGSVIIEDIFKIPGLGRYIFQEVSSNNTPAVLAVFSILGLLTLLGYLVSDYLIYRANPKIRLKESVNN